MITESYDGLGCKTAREGICRQRTKLRDAIKSPRTCITKILNGK